MDKAGANTHVFVHKAVVFNLGNMSQERNLVRGTMISFIIIAWGDKV